MICRVINLNSESKTTKRAPATSFTSILDRFAAKYETTYVDDFTTYNDSYWRQ